MSQPKPVAGKDAVTEKVIKDLLERTEKGVRTYGRPLETFNGRDSRLDAYEEVLDLAQYLKQGLMEQDDLREALKEIVLAYDAMPVKPSGALQSAVDKAAGLVE